jgi:hypothetical protein
MFAKKAPSWREALAQKMALVAELDAEVGAHTEQLEQDFDLIALRHDHEAWLDTFHQRLAREEMSIREQEAVFPVLHEKIAQHERALKEHNLTLHEMYGDKLREVRAQSPPKRQSQIVAPQFVMEGWLTEQASARQRRRYYKLAPVTSTAPVRMYGYESDIAKAPVSIIQIPSKSTVTFNSATQNSLVCLCFVCIFFVLETGFVSGVMYCNVM